MHPPKIVAMKKSKSFASLGFESDESKQLVDLLNELLCNLQVHYQKLRNFHWNVEGGDFYDLHDQFQLEYEAVTKEIDEIAERIRVFGFKPLSTLKEYLELSNIKEASSETKAEDMVKEIINDFEILFSYMIEVIEYANEIDDLSTAMLITEFMKRTEKSHWMLTAFSSKK